MLMALALARGAFGVTEPNPRVGCVVGDEAGRIFGQGSTQRAGGPHAEVMALRAAQQAGHDPRGSTVWVTLEPCAHHGRTPPCCDALVAAGVARVVVGATDPFPQVSGAGLARLRAAGIKVEMADPDLADAAREINLGFFSRFERGLPWVRMKTAQSLDGRVALSNGESQWISGEAARVDGHAWRRRASAVLTGIGTVLADNPRLDVRHVITDLQPLRVVLDSSLRLPPTAKILSPPGRVLVVTTSHDVQRAEALQALGAEVVVAPTCDHGIDLRWVLQHLAGRQINELHVEAGPKLNAALLKAGMVDELLVYLAPKLIGPGLPMAQLTPLRHLTDALPFRLFEVQQLGEDARLRLFRADAATSSAVAGGTKALENGGASTHDVVGTPQPRDFL
jgi:diaminohydroxyphosphoribosylaminopyrimidine deaminase/5-amino-6-(5-phosphoribosylamino)uracil reductase